MLVLSRALNESIIIDGNIEIIVVEVRGNKVRLGVKAPAGVTVNRKEIEERIAQGEGRKRPVKQD